MARMPPPTIPPNQRDGSTSTTEQPAFAAATAASIPDAVPPYTQTSHS